MKWVNRAFWAAAWGCWVWLGFGLYRELPRDLGFPVCTLKLGRGDNLIGWISGEPTAVTVNNRHDERPIILRTWDGATGDLRAEFKGPKEGFVVNYLPCLRHGALVCSERPSLPGRKRHRGWSVLDLKTGEWLDLPFGADDQISFARSKPLAMFVERGGSRRAPLKERWQVVVVDMRDGKELLRIADDVGSEPTRELLDAPGVPLFLGDDAVVVPTVVEREMAEAGSPDDSRVEVWRLDAPQGPTNVWPGMRIGDNPVAVAGGRVAWHHRFTEPANADVFDLTTGRSILAHPPRAERVEPKGLIEYHGPPPRGPVLSPDGRGAYLPMGDLVLDVDAGTVRWRSDGSAHSVGVDKQGRFQLHEEWRLPWLSKGLKLETHALRDLGTWRLVHRTWKPTWPSPTVEEPSPDWLLGEDNEVYKLPPLVNYPLLALCQTILALPLILFWSILRWRRNRRLRMARVRA